MLNRLLASRRRLLKSIQNKNRFPLPFTPSLCQGALRRAGLLAAVALVLGGAPVRGADAPSLSSDSERATAGFFRLSWAGPAGADYQLQKSASPRFDPAGIIYQGPDTARVLSGQADGRYFFRVRLLESAADPGPWSEPVLVEVTHHPLSRALSFFMAGAVAFLATLALIVVGHGRHGRGDGVHD